MTISEREALKVGDPVCVITQHFGAVATLDNATVARVGKHDLGVSLAPGCAPVRFSKVTGRRYGYSRGCYIVSPKEGKEEWRHIVAKQKRRAMLTSLRAIAWEELSDKHLKQFVQLAERIAQRKEDRVT